MRKKLYSDLVDIQLNMVRVSNVSAHAMVFVFALLLLLLGSNLPVGSSEVSNILITHFYSCDAFGNPQDYFPKETTAYFNVTLTNLMPDPKNISVDLSIEDELQVIIGSSTLNTTLLPEASKYYIMDIFIPKWAFVGSATAYVIVSERGIGLDSKTTKLYIGTKDSTPPAIRLFSPENLTYVTESIPLTFTVNERTSWIGYRLNALENLTIAGNTTLTNLPNGSHSIRIYAKDTSGNVGSSREVYFNVLVVHDVAVVDAKCSSAEIYEGQIADIIVTVRNEGTVTEMANVTVYTNTSAIQTLAITNLGPNSQENLIFSWNTTNKALGNYSISAQVTPTLDEMDITDNTYTGNTLNVMSRPDIAITQMIPSKTVVGQGYATSISVTVQNQGDHPETFGVTVYADINAAVIGDEIIVGMQNVTLTGESSADLIFTWNTLSSAKGNYTVSAYARPVPDETDTADNNYIDGTVLITIPGDVNGDKKVDGKDIAIIAKAYGSRIGQPNYVPNADINSDGKIDGKDYSICYLHQGERW